MKTSAKALKSTAVFARDYGVPFLILLVIALADGMVRTVALLAFGLVVASKLLILASEYLKTHAPTPRSARRTA